MDMKESQRASATGKTGAWSTPTLGGPTPEQWIARYSRSHQHPVNRACHTLGIPTILLSLAVSLLALFVHRLWTLALGLFLAGWLLQFIGMPLKESRRSSSTTGASF